MMGLVVVALGAVFVWRSRAIRRTPNGSQVANGQAKQFRDAGVVIAVAGVIIVLGSLLALARGGF